MPRPPAPWLLGAVLALGPLTATAQLNSPSFAPCDRGGNSVYPDACGGTPALNQPRSEVITDSVTERQRPAYAPIGFDLGSLTLGPPLGAAKSETGPRPLNHVIAFPSAALQIEQDDNVLRSKNNPKSSLVTRLKAGLDLASNYGRHGFDISTQVEDIRHAALKGEDFTNFKIKAALWADVGDAGQVVIAPTASREKEGRGGINDTATIRRPGFDQQVGVKLQYIYNSDPWFLRPEISWQRSQFRERGDNSRGLVSDYNDITAKARLAYLTTPTSYYFIEPRLSRIHVDKNLDSQFKRAGTGTEILVGSWNDVTPVLHYEIAVGWMWRRYDDQRLETASGPSFDAKLVWNPLNVLTLQTRFSRKLFETTTASYAGLIYTSLFFGGDLDIADPLFLSASLDLGHGRYVGGLAGTGSRSDDYAVSRLGVTYLISHWGRINAGLERSSRTSSDHLVDYIDNRFFASFRLAW